MHSRDRAHDRQPQPVAVVRSRPGRFGAIEAIKDSGEILLWNRGVSIADADPHRVVSFGDAHADGMRQRSARVLEPVRQYIGERPANQPGNGIRDYGSVNAATNGFSLNPIVDDSDAYTLGATVPMRPRTFLANYTAATFDIIEGGDRDLSKAAVVPSTSFHSALWPTRVFRRPRRFRHGPEQHHRVRYPTRLLSRCRHWRASSSAPSRLILRCREYKGRSPCMRFGALSKLNEEGRMLIDLFSLAASVRNRRRNLEAYSVATAP